MTQQSSDNHIYFLVFLLMYFCLKAAEKEVNRVKAEEEAQEKRKIKNAERKAAKKAEQKKAKMEMKKRKVNGFSVKVSFGRLYLVFNQKKGLSSWKFGN